MLNCCEGEDRTTVSGGWQWQSNPSLSSLCVENSITSPLLSSFSPPSPPPFLPKPYIVSSASPSDVLKTLVQRKVLKLVGDDGFNNNCRVEFLTLPKEPKPRQQKRKLFPSFVPTFSFHFFLIHYLSTLHSSQTISSWRKRKL